MEFKIFVLIGIVGYLINNIKTIKENKSTKNKIALLVAMILALFGFFMLAKAFM